MRDDLAPAVWRKSRRSSGNAACVEVAAMPDCHLVRDSKLGDASPVLAVPAGQFVALLREVRDGKLQQ